MFEPNLSGLSWAPELFEAAQRGPEQTRRVALRYRPSLEDSDADEVGDELAALLDLNLETPGHLGPLVAAASVFAGPRTLARVGALLRTDLDGSAWKIELGLEILERNRCPESALQQLLCSRDAHEIRVLQRAAALYRGRRSSMGELATAALAAAPEEHLGRYLALALETAMLERTRFVTADLERSLVGPAAVFLRRVLWARYDGRRAAEVFAVDPDSTTFVDTEWERVSLKPSSLVCAVHPADLDDETRSRWGIALGDSQIVGLFAQLDREHGPAVQSFPFHALERDVEHEELVRFLYRNGWVQHRGGRSFELEIRGSVLQLKTVAATGETRRLETLSLSRPLFDRDSREDDVIYNEAIAASVKLLEEFAPELI